MFKLKVLFLFVVIMAFKTVTALDCHQCWTPEECQSGGQIVTCHQDHAEQMKIILKPLYPDLDSQIATTSRFQCVKITHRYEDTDKYNFFIKGCMYDTEKGLCSIYSKFPNGYTECSACNLNRCNSAAGLKWSFALLIVGWIVAQFAR